jgi:hypothetical protein
MVAPARGFGRAQPQTSRTLTPCTLGGHPWVNPDPHCGVMPGAADGWCVDGRLAVLFHTTTEANAAAILRDGFKPSPGIKVGGWAELGGPAGRQMPPGIWASIRPTVPHDSDIWMPNVSPHPWAVLQVVAPMAVVPERCVFEHTWTVAQFCLQPSDVLGVVLLPPSQMPLLIHPETVRKLASYRSEYHGPSPYLDAIDAAAAIDAAGVALPPLEA